MKEANIDLIQEQYTQISTGLEKFHQLTDIERWTIAKLFGINDPAIALFQGDKLKHLAHSLFVEYQKEFDDPSYSTAHVNALVDAGII